ncbi:MAG: hypothetical protein M3Z30_07765 [Gemmatimonadota bacterium]|nr:hypothetical protein [Gemmatimonadota bacterium]
MRRTLWMMLMGAAATVSAACADSGRLAGPVQFAGALGASASIQDAAHGGIAGFYFLEPLVSQPSDPGTLDTTQSSNLRVEVCRLGADPSIQTCQAPAIVISATSPVFIDLNGNHYQVNWQTDTTFFPANMYYRVSVVDIAAGGAWGHVDVFLGSSGKGFHSINTTDFTPLLDGRTVPIKFRVDNGAVPPTAGGGTSTAPSPS